MKILQKITSRSDWGRFVYLSTESFDWHEEVGNISAEKQEAQKVFYEKLGKNKEELKSDLELEFNSKELLTVQIARHFGEPYDTKNWSVKTHRKTFNALTRLTVLGYNVDRLNDFEGKNLVVGEDGKLKIENISAR